jgi:hypothetical protein
MKREMSFNQFLGVAALGNAVLLFGLWLFGKAIIQADDMGSLNRWLLCILISAGLPALVSMWFVFRRKKGLAVCAILAPVPLWTVLTLGLVALDVTGIKF